MRTMSDEAEQRLCDEDFGSEDEEGEEADVESFLEDNSSELVDRLRELEAENSALLLANESQREAYERCLDEVANHVVQALLNQKDLREECIKLKMLVFDLERQNRALCELFQQKLPNQPTAHYQVQPGPLPEYNAQLHNDSAKQVETPQSDAQAKGNGYRTQHASPGPRGPAASMEALSPFFKKKAHILEVLRKMEETDPLKFHPSTSSLSFCDYSQVLLSTEAVLATADPLKAHHHAPPCRCSCPQEEEHQHVNGDGGVVPPCEGGGNSRCLHCSKKSPDAPAKPCGGHVCSPPPRANGAAQNHAAPTGECHAKSTTTTTSALPSKQSTESDGPAPPLTHHVPIAEKMANGIPEVTTTRAESRAKGGSSSSEELTGFYPAASSQPPVVSAAKETADHDGPTAPPPSPPPPGDGNAPPANGPSASAAPPEKDEQEEASPVRADFTVSPSTSSCLGDVKAAAVNSPSKLFKFLKIPSSSSSSSGGGDRSPAAASSSTSPVRLSPQLTRSSRIPCRTNNYEVYHSPVPTRRATTTERCRPPPPPPSRSESYPATHSAPTSPPQAPPPPQDARCSPPPAKESMSYGSLSTPTPKAGCVVSRLGLASSGSSSSSAHRGASQRVPPHYENVADVASARGEEPPHRAALLEKRTTLPSHAKPGGGERKLVKSLPESILLNNPAPLLPPPPPQQRKQSSSSASESSSDEEDEEEEDEEDDESPVWVNHHSLPTSSGLAKAPGGGRANNYARVRDNKALQGAAEGRGENASRSSDITRHHPPPPPPPPPAKRSDSSSIPKRPGTSGSGSASSGRSPADSGHHAFKDRLAALGKLRSSEDLRIINPTRPADATANADVTPCNNDVDGGGGDERSKTAERGEQHKEEQRHHSKYTDSLDGKPRSSNSSSGLKYPGSSSPLYEQQQGAKSGPPPPVVVKTEPPCTATTKTDGPHRSSKLGLPSPNADAPQVLRNNMKCPGSLNLAYNNARPGLSPHHGGGSSSPSKVPPPTKSPSNKPCPPARGSAKQPGGGGETPPRYASKSEERSKISGKGGKKNPMYGDSLPPPPPRPPASSDGQEDNKPPQQQQQQQQHQQRPPVVPVPQSAIEQKVMKGIEEKLLLKLQEQDLRGGGPPVPEVKQKASNGIASWFGLKKSKLPALSRSKADASSKANKDEKREWKISIPSVGRDSVKVASRCKEGVEGLNISTLMEKAEGLRRALEEERAYVERSGRGHSCEVVMDPAQGQLAVMYRGARSDNFMQQLLNRVDGKDMVISVPQRRLSFDCKASRPAFHPGDVLSHSTSSRDDMEKGSDGISNVTSDENLADSVHSQHFAGSGSSTYTLDSGIGTFPLPDCSSGAAGRSLSKMRGGAEQHASGSPGRVGRRARTLDREMSSQEESYVAHRQLVPTIQYGSVLEGRGPAGGVREEKDGHAANMFSPRSKTWTFPNLKTPAGPAEVYLAVEEEEEEAVVSYGSPFRGGVKPGGPSSSRVAVDPASLPVPVQPGLSRRGKSRTPSVPEMSREAGLELLRERPEEALSPSRPQVLETPESLSDSLYDSLSSCGSQG